jgi:uncharacterized protein (DUF362 family)
MINFSDIIEFSRDRRNFVKAAVVTASGIFLKPFAGISDMGTPADVTQESKVCLTAGKDRRENVYNALKPFEKEVGEAIRNKKVVIKANLVDPEIELAAVHRDAVRGVLDFLQPIYKKKVFVGDSNGRPGGTKESLRNHKYYELEKEYNVKCVDLNDNPTKTMWIIDQGFHPLGIEIIDTFLDPDVYMISVTRPKTHGNAGVTLSVKNIVMGSPVNIITEKNRLIRGQKTKMHAAGDKGLNWNIFHLAGEIRPDLCVIDGLVGMEGNGPSQGTPVEHGIALAGTDRLAVDRMMLLLMDVNFDDIGYLNYLAWAGDGQSDPTKIKVLGENPMNHIRKYKLADNFDKQMIWKEGLLIDKK